MVRGCERSLASSSHSLTSNRPDRDMDLEWQVGPDKIRTQNGLGQSEFAWQTFAKMVRTPSGTLF